MSDQIIVMTKACPQCGDIGEIVMSAAVAEHGANLRWADVPIQECYPTLTPAEREQVKSGIHAECLARLMKGNTTNATPA